MSTELKLRRGTTLQHSTFTGDNGEVTVDTSNHELVVHDGVTAGGHRTVNKESLSDTETSYVIAGVPAKKLADAPVNAGYNGVLLNSSADSTVPFNALSTAGLKAYLNSGTCKASGIIPTDSWGLSGAGRSKTTISNNSTNSSILNMSGQFDNEFEHMTLAGLGSDSETIESGVTFNGLLNGRRNTFSYMDFVGFSGHGAQFSAGWNNSVYKSRFISSEVGLKFKLSPILAGWSGSGFKLDESYIASCNVGLEMENIWNFTSINTVFEDCVLPIDQTGSASPAVWINNWFESNQQSPRLTYSNIFIGGRLEGGEVPPTGFYGNMTLPVAPFDYECITEILYGIRVFRDPNDEVFAADGQGVKAFKAHSSLGWSPEDISGSTAKRLSVGYGSGSFKGGVTSTVWGGTVNIWDDITTLTGRRHFNSFDTPSMPYLGVKVQGNVASASGGIGFTRVVFSTGTYETGGGGATESAERWQVSETGQFAPVADNAYDIGISGFRVRDIRVVNAPIVGSDVRIKKDDQSIPQELLDFAMSVEIKQYKLKSGTSGRNHYGIIITPEFLQSLAKVQTIAECGAFCQDVFTDMGGNPITQDVGGVQLGDIWQVRYDEWQNILLEAMRRKIRSM